MCSAFPRSPSTVSGTSLRRRRLDNEWRLVNELAVLNEGVLDSLKWETDSPIDRFLFRLRQTTAPVWNGTDMTCISDHSGELRFPRFFPSVPIEAYVHVPIFHPNIDPLSGFVCVWDRFSIMHTGWEAIRRLQQILTWRLVNSESVHVMQPDALLWRQSDDRAFLPDFVSLCIPAEWRLEQEPFRVRQQRRHRLSAISE
jgi:ubiquitin-protein ligase